MKVVSENKDKIILRLEKGEEVIKSLTDVATEHKIKGSFFIGIGALENIELSYFNRNTKNYSVFNFNDVHELANLTGNISIDKETGDPIIHAHATLGDTNLKAYAGHLQKAQVAVTVEICIFSSTDVIERGLDFQTGLKLLQ